MLTNNDVVNLLLIGFGPHAKRIYYPLLEASCDDPALNLCAAVDFISAKRRIDAYLADKRLQPEILYFNDSDNSQTELGADARKRLDDVVRKYAINGVIIATEPLAHMPYARWALESGLSILMDKPISSYEGISTSIEKSIKLAEDYQVLNALYQKQRRDNPDQVFSLMAQRRYQTSFNLIKRYIAECFAQTHCPVTNVQTFHSDGQWRMPTEMVEQHYHPYNQGYGKCSHSGYHYFDIVPFVLEAGFGDGKQFDNIDVFSMAIRPDDVLSQLALDDYRALFGKRRFDESNHYDEKQLGLLLGTFGEVDCSSNICFKSGDRTLTAASINLCHNGYSQRNWVTAAGRDLYKGNGRVSHESHIFQQGPFQSIHFHSYKSDELPGETLDERHRVGTKEHLEIYIFRNDKMLGGKHVEVFDIDDIIAMEGGRKGLKGKSKAKAFYEFIAGMRGEIAAGDMVSDFSKHEVGAMLTSAVYQSISHRYHRLNPLINRRFKSREPILRAEALVP
ncbi:Gfo/Idh/MocA family oxidoreductase [Dickeya dadantii subsp. dieffenbachiae]|uniref:Gfo/Idh/MocA family oxidoreductase n=1 Tax=Dickeya dadantii TaxID=204038 RepID=UPI0005761D15|nr:Gfo/Idh/MocA family oxidoreductase [Dickeya dadantii]